MVGPDTIPMKSRLKEELDDEDEGMPVMHNAAHKTNNVLAIAVAIGSLVVQFGTLVWWGGRIDEKVERHDKYIEDQKQINSQAALKLSVTEERLRGIKEVLDRIDRKVDGSK